ncbi:MAG: pilus assembly protein [Promicromonosporaceae bacterium]|nr:pilus assembly protein [Promicromonosporaceae bacterium]
MIRAERGAAVAEFALVSTLVVLLFGAVVQVALAQHVRTLLIDAAGEGARVAARADREPQDGLAWTQELITATLPKRFAADVSAETMVFDGLPLVAVTVTAPLPLMGLLGPSGVITVTGHALKEGP